MSVLLTTAFDPGDNDAGNTYPRSLVICYETFHEARYINVCVEVGDYVSSVWVKGPGHDQETYVINDAAYDSFETNKVTESEDGHKTLQGMHKDLEQWIIANGPTYLAGTVE